jgi:hypothetical protein
MSDLTAKLATDNMIRWLELEALEKGTTDQRERYHESVLPDEELTGLARVELFANFLGLSRWASRDHLRLERELKHGSHTALSTNIAYETAEVTELTAEEWATLRRIQGAAEQTRKHQWIVRPGATVTVEPSTHWASCSVCEAETFRSSAKVTIQWAGRLLVREYAI